MSEVKKELSDLVYIQFNLKAPKNQRNAFGNYNYRSCEDILEAAKPLLAERNCTLTVSDDIVQVADRIYVKATATLRTSEGVEYSNTAFAREALSKKGMDESQVTGATSSYARKYALNGLFCIDDTKDADALNVNKEYTQQEPPKPQEPTLHMVLTEISKATSLSALKEIYSKYPIYQSNQSFTAALTAKKDQLQGNGKS